MGKLLMVFYFLVGLLCSISIVGSIIVGHVLLVSWLLLAAAVNFLLFYIVRKAERMKNEEKKKPKLVRTL